MPPIRHETDVWLRNAVPKKLMEAGKKPEQIIEKIVTGKIEKFYSQICLVEQGFVKDPDVTVGKLVESKGATVNGFVRFEGLDE